MSLDSLSNQIKAEAKAEAETIIKAAEKQAKGIRKEAEDEAATHLDAALARHKKTQSRFQSKLSQASGNRIRTQP